jgi:hypothetical protein
MLVRRETSGCSIGAGAAPGYNCKYLIYIIKTYGIGFALSITEGRGPQGPMFSSSSFGTFSGAATTAPVFFPQAAQAR